MAPQVGLEPTTLRLTAEFHPLHPTARTNYAQQNNRKCCCGFAPFWLALAAVHGHFHGQWADSGDLRWATTSWCATTWLSTGTTRRRQCDKSLNMNLFCQLSKLAFGVSAIPAHGCPASNMSSRKCIKLREV